MIRVLGACALAIHVALMLAGAVPLAGVSNALRARLLGHGTPHLLQPCRELARLMRKQTVRAENASRLFDVAPIVAFAATAAAAALVPSFTLGMASAPVADLVLVAGLLAGSRAIGLLAAMDCGVSAGGGAASRRATSAALAQPVVLLTILVVALAAGSSNIDAIAIAMRDSVPGRAMPVAGAAFAVAIVAFAMAPESGEEAALDAEYGGRLLALIRWTAAIRKLTLVTLFTTICVPVGLADAATPSLWLVGSLLWAAKVALIWVAAALVRTLAVDLRPIEARRMLGAALAVALLAAILLLAGQAAT